MDYNDGIIKEPLSTFHFDFNNPLWLSGSIPTGKLQLINTQYQTDLTYNFDINYINTIASDSLKPMIGAQPVNCRH